MLRPLKGLKASYFISQGEAANSKLKFILGTQEKALNTTLCAKGQKLTQIQVSSLSLVKTD